jgi:hypothetical protein
MTVTRYIVLSSSNDSIVKRFRAIEYKPVFINSSTLDYTIGGNTDKQSAPVVKGWIYTLRVPIDEPDDVQYGSYGDIRTLFMLANANAVPSDVITLTDHFGDEYSVYFRESMEPVPLTTSLEGASAWMIVPISLIEAVL